MELRWTGLLGDVYHHSSTVRVSKALSGLPVETVESKEDQCVTRYSGDQLTTAVVVRDQREFPTETPAGPAAAASKAETLRLQGNDAFRAADFPQAAALYTLALNEDASNTVILANRAQCWLKLGDHAKALEDAEACIAVDPSNTKAHFRKGLALHAMKRYGAAIRALLEAEKTDPKHEQVQHALKMAQMMAQKHGPGE